MTTGELNKRLELQASTKVGDGMGAFTVTWATKATVFASLWPLRGEEAIEAMKLSSTITHRVRMRYRRDIKASWRIKYGNRYFAIVSVINMGEESKFLELMVKEGA